MIAAGFVVLAIVGAVARWQLAKLNSLSWPAGTFTANVGAAFVLGAIADSSSTTLTLAGTALLGSYSTFSTITREVADLGDNEGVGRALGYLAATLAAGVTAALVGLELG